MKHFKYILVILFFAGFHSSFSQDEVLNTTSKFFEVKVRVIDKETSKPIKNAEVQVNGIVTNFSDINGVYRVKARVNDQLVVDHPDFEIVYYTIKSNEDIKIVVENYTQDNYSSMLKTRSSSKADLYHEHLDSAKFYQKKDIEKSLSFIEKALKDTNSRKRNANTYKTLADIYFFWKQYDLAISNYKISLQIEEDSQTRIKLAEAQFLTKKYEESEASYKIVLDKKLSSYQKVLVNEGLGDLHFASKKFSKAEVNYNKALKIAKNNLVTPKITDLNSKLADVYVKKGNRKKADNLYQNSLKLASKENKKRSLKEQEKVADYYNKSNRYDDEIKLRQQTLEEAESVSENNISSIKNDTINSQKINYKIGNAYVLKKEYKEAVPFLEKSIKEADANEDLVVKKDATRRLSELYATVGDYDKALKSYREYVTVVDSLYVRKEQEIQQAKRFSKKIADNQNRIASLEKDKELNQSKISLAYKDQQLTQESNKRQRLIIYSLIASFLLMSLLAYFMYRTNKQQKLANNLLALKSMRSQMNPHFIFNALNSVNSFIAVNDERNANRYLSEFSVLMRSVLENSDEDFIPLTKEIELLELYVKLEHNRFKDKFDYSILVDKVIDLDQFSIPPMLLQPYIENAIWHGLRYKKEKGNLKISITQKDKETILISILDDGIGRKQSQELKTKNQLKQRSKGMSTIKNRIAILNDMYKDRVSVEVSDVLENGEGTKVELLLKKK
ncbi:tetratricopeptide repeat protein [Tenacibaculum adriaticum]|uniref:Tetratricopeptide repeat protein n=1 Tax=Tenacibaculum adriaticum TaxID=413713 RepID=A0A5S5DQB8_9FLAO|nr:histidine kinase [Tenacibaculum adriaticum]TYP97874.1 tetratricopeptide repeat protein [Tenacibaculum adriaticum]